MADSFNTREPGATSGGGQIHDMDLKTGDIRILMQGMGAFGAKIDRLITDRKDDRDELAKKIEEVKSDLSKKMDEAKAEFKEFRKDDFKPLQTDVSNLRLKWAWMAGVGAVVGVFTGVLVEYIKSHMG